MTAFLEQHHLGALDRKGARARQQRRPPTAPRVEQLTAADEILPERRGARDAEARAWLLEDLPAERQPLVDERRPRGRVCSLHSCRETGRAAADHENVVLMVSSETEARGAKACVAGGEAAGHTRRRRALLAGRHLRQRRADGRLVDRGQLPALLLLADERAQPRCELRLPFWTPYEPYSTCSGFGNGTSLSLLPFDLLNCARR